MTTITIMIWVEKMSNDYSAVINAIRRKLRKIYNRAADELKEKVQMVLKPLQSQINNIEKKVKSGEITKEEAKYKVTALLASVDEHEIFSIAETLHKANTEADKEMKAKIPGVIASALSHESYDIERELGEDIGLVPFSEEDINGWMNEDEDIFDPGEIDEDKDIEWNEENIRRFFKTGTLLGLGASALVAYIVGTAVERNQESFFRRVFDVILGANDEGRQLAMSIATRRGAEMEKEWNATRDFKTRDAHRELDGQRVPVDEPFKVDGEEIRFPRDPWAKAYLRCNCRCAMKRTRAHWRSEGEMRENIRDEHGIKPIIPRMTYSEWMEMKEQELGRDEINRIIQEMKREQARRAYRRRKRRLKQGGDT